jgi:hypothetical protein
VLVQVGSWMICTACWIEGARPSPALEAKRAELAAEAAAKNERSKKKPTPAKAPERSAAKEEVGSFERHPSSPDADDAASSRSGYFNGGIQYVPDEDGYW